MDRRDPRTGALPFRSNPTSRSLAAAAVLALALCGAPAATALAGTGSTARASATLITPGSAAATARCPSGSRSAGGGFKIADGYQPPPADTGSRSLTQVDALIGKRSWRVLTSGFGSATTTLSAYARCLSGIRSVTLATESANLGPTVAKRLQPRCPPTRRLLGGGYRVDPTFHFAPLPSGGALILPLESRKVGSRDWRVTAANVSLGNSVTGRLTAYAICASGRAKSMTAAKSVPMTYGNRAGALAKCPRKWHTTSGGFKASPSFDGPTPTDFILPLFDASAPQGSRAWGVGGFYYSPFTGGIPSGKITAYAYCEHN